MTGPTADERSNPGMTSGDAGQPPAPRRGNNHTPPPGGRWLRVLMWTVLGLVLLLVAVVLALWLWAGSQNSMAQTLALVQRYVPATSALETSGVSGSLRDGGRIASLRWKQPDGVSVAADGVELAWQPLALLGGTVRINRLNAERIQIVNRTPPPAVESPSQPLESLVLPIRIELAQVHVGHFGWDDPEAFAFDGLDARYSYNGLDHTIAIDRIALLDGNFQLDAKLGASAPMPLDAQLRGTMAAKLPEGRAPLPLTLEATAKGPLQLLDIVAQAQAQAVATATSPQSADANTPASAPTNASTHASTQAPSSTTPSSAPSSSATSADLPSAQINARLAIWKQGLPIEQADVALKNFDLQSFQATLPRTLLDGTARLTPAADQKIAIEADLQNRLPGAWDRQRLPLARVQLQGNWQDNADGRTATLQQLLLAAGGGELSGQGRFALPAATVSPTTASAAPTTEPALAPSVTPWQADADLTLKNINPQALYSTLAAAPLSGTLRAKTREIATTPAKPAPQASAENSSATTPPGTTATLPAVDFDIDIQGQPPKSRGNLLWIQQAIAQGSWAQDTLDLKKLQLASNQARVEGSARYQLQQQNATAKLILSVPGADGQVDGSISPIQGRGSAKLGLTNATQTLAWLRQLPGMKDVMAGQQASGSAALTANWQGGWNNPTLDAVLDVPRLALNTPAKGTDGEMALHDARATLRGRLDQAALELKAKARAGGQNIDLATRLNGGQKAARGAPPRWVVNLEELIARVDDPVAPAGQRGNARGQWSVETTQPFTATWQNQTLQTTAGAARLVPPGYITANSQDSLPIAWQPVRLRTNAQGLAELSTAGSARGLPFAWANALSGGALAKAGVTGDLSLNAEWNVQLDQNLQARVVIERAGGDINLLSEEAANDTLALSADQVKTPPGRGTTKITVINPGGARGTTSSTAPAANSQAATTTGRRMTAGVRALRLVATANNNQINATFDWDTERLGNAKANVSSPLSRIDGAWQWAPEAPLSGQLQAKFTRLGIWSVLAPPGWRMRGQLDVDATFAGTRSAPLLNGTLRGSDLALRSVLDGVELDNGKFQATLQGTRMVLDSFSLDGAGGGNVSAQGQVDWSSEQPDMRMEARIQQLAVTNRADRQVTVSGQLLSTLSGQRLDLTGNVTVDRARIVLPESSKPTLDEDVHVRNPLQAQAEAAAQEAGATAIQPRIDVTLDMGRDFRLQGYGINTQLRGQLKAVTPESGSAVPRITGDITTYDGEFRAYGQWLDIDRGVIRFSGPYDNPSLDILAIRPRLTERVGVQVRGPALSPVIRLYSESGLTDSETLAWLLLGRSGAAGGAEAAMLQQAAAAVLAGGSGGPGIAGKFGLDQLSVGGSKNDAGETEASLTVGKQLARDLYVTYERSLSGTLGTLYVFYDLSRRWTLRGESGAENAVDLIFTLPYD